MSELLLLLTPVVPLVLAAAWAVRRWRPWVGRLSSFAPLPAIALAACCSDTSVDLPWILLGSRWGLDSTGRIFLGFTAALWFASGIFARYYLAHDLDRNRFDLFWLLTMAGNLGAIVSHDMLSFLFFFTLMSLAAYGLITHDRQPQSLRAGRIYIVLTVCGEALLFCAVVLIAQQTGGLTFDALAGNFARSPLQSLIVGLLVAGFGIKLGMMPLHVWLPLAHPVAPTPASAVLSGAIIKGGLLGLMRFLPFGEAPIEDWGIVCVVLGIASALAAALIGITQEDAKTVLAYSSVSQMGLLSILLGVGMMVPAAWPTIRIGVLLFAVHHAIAKAALFLGVGVAQAQIRSFWKRSLVAAALVVPALAVAGLPFTSGLPAKNAVKYGAAAASDPWATILNWVLPLTGVTTTLLLLRFLHLVWPGRHDPHGKLTPGTVVPWAVLALGVVVLFPVLAWGGLVKPSWTSLTMSATWKAMWPIASAAIIMAAFLVSTSTASRARTVCVPAGDLVVPLSLALARCARTADTAFASLRSIWATVARERLVRLDSSVARNTLNRIQQELGKDVALGLLIGLLAVAIAALAMM